MPSIEQPSKLPSFPINGELTVITTHVNADFDAVASLLAAQKLYPGARVVFPGSQERNLRNFFIQSMIYLFNLVEIKEIDFSKIKRLVLVDTQRVERIGKMAVILDNPGLEIHTYDHHPQKDDDIQGDFGIHRLTGATVTIMTKILRDNGIRITSEEATILGLGIYEDTGSFTFPSTTTEDFQAAAYLVANGANIHVISNLISREISPEQIHHLNDLIQSITHHLIRGVEVAITSVNFDHYLPDFAFLVHKMVKMENINAVFALGMMENKVHIVGRSSTDEVDVGNILSALGGGGHPSAASAAIKDQTLAQVENDLLKELHRQIKPQRLAQHIMSSPAISAGPEISCAQANQMLTRYNINALLVISNKAERVELLGYITRQVIEKAIFHDLGHLPIKDYMNTELMMVAPNAELLEVQEKIIGNKQRILPVANDAGILGVITRTDLLTVLVQQTQMTRETVSDPTKNRINARTRNIANYMKERLPRGILHTLVKVGEIAAELNFEAYVVGGFVRDLFLYRTNEDIDIVIEGDGIEFAKAYAKAVGARIHAHRKFGTAVVIFPDDHKIDIATARMEYYRSPAALPDVEMSSIKLDLFRRDFTINTLAINLNPKKFGRLIDFFGAQKDIKDKAIRVLHNLSFVEDPTRVFRALRFEQRFGFAIGKLTVSLINNAVKMDFFKRLSGRRVFSELRLILEEENPISAVTRMADFDLLQVVHPSLVADDHLITLFKAVKSAMSWHDLLFVEEPYLRWAVYFMAMIKDCDLMTSNKICTELELAPRHIQLLCQNRIVAQKRLAEMEQRLPKAASALYHCLKDFRTELILFMMAAATQKPVKKAISHYYNELRKIQPLIGGQDLIDMGLKPGAIFRQVLDEVQDARLNGTVQTRDDERLFVKKWINRHSSGATAYVRQRQKP